MNDQIYKEQLEKIYNDLTSQMVSMRTEMDGLNTIITDMKMEHEGTASMMLLPHVSRHLNETVELSWYDTGDTGDTAWVLGSCGLVLMMSVPGLVLFYSGMIRTKNVLTTVMQIASICCLITFLWMAFGYSLALSPADANKSSNYLYGDSGRFWLVGMEQDSVHQSALTIPEPVYCMYQLTFAMITPALMCGSFADRMKYGPMLIFMALWHILVYCPVAHAHWHPDGFLYELGALDYAGGGVVHIASGVAGLISSVILGHRKNYGKEAFEPHNILLTAVGAFLLWVGWFGFNGGSAVAANTRAGMAMLCTHISGAVGALSWSLTEYLVTGKPKMVGLVNGLISGLVTITPACGYVEITGAFFMGLIAGPVCYGGSNLKHYLGYDDALDAFGVHAVGGILGGFLTGFFASAKICGYNGVLYAKDSSGGELLSYQVYAILFCIGWSGVISTALLLALQYTVGLRVSSSEEDAGLDESYHGESLMVSLNPERQINSLEPEGVQLIPSRGLFEKDAKVHVSNESTNANVIVEAAGVIEDDVEKGK